MQDAFIISGCNEQRRDVSESLDTQLPIVLLVQGRCAQGCPNRLIRFDRPSSLGGPTR